MSATHTIALEIGVEELPAGYVQPALDALAQSLAGTLARERLPVGRLEASATPRRLLVVMRDVASSQTALEERVMGPARSVAFDKEGRPTKAALGFARGHGIDPSALETTRTEKGEYVSALVTRPTLPAGDVVARVLPDIVAGIPFPKTMTWDSAAPRFARPIRWVVALVDGAVLPVTIAGCAAGRATFGHRLLHPEATDVPHAARLDDALERVFVLADAARRRARVVELAAQRAADLGGRVIADDELADIVTQMVEWPAAVAGRFDAEFLELPREVIVTALREHQRYFAVENAEGRLLAGFVCITNGVASDAIRAGHERVLRARLADARFHWTQDLRVPPEKKVPDLAQVVWIEGLGSLLDRTRRLQGLTSDIADAIGADKGIAHRAALLSKVDLLSDMLQDGKEYTSLQGVIGAAYARALGEDERVTRAMRDQYRPSFAGDTLPETREGATLALADKLDLIAACFLTDRAPTGAEDPFGVRRAALGVLRILLERGISLDIDVMLRNAMRFFASPEEEPAHAAAMSFLSQRLGAMLRTAGVDHDLVDATLAADASNPVDAVKRAETLARGRATDDLALAAQCARRAANFLRDVADGDADVSDASYTEPSERALLTALAQAERDADRALAARDHDALLRAALSLKSPVDEFFTAVLVLDPDPAVRARRIALVRRVDRLFRRGWDMSRVQGETHTAVSS